MPSPSAIKKAADKRNGDFGTTLAKRRSQDFKSKIQGWNDKASEVSQSQSEIVVTVEETKIENPKDAEPQPKRLATVELPVKPEVSKPPGTTPLALRLPSRQIDLERRAWVRKKSKPQVDLLEEVKEATSPKKRVISDGSWRKDRNVETPKQKDKVSIPVQIPTAATPNAVKPPDSTGKWAERTSGHYKWSKVGTDADKLGPKARSPSSPPSKKTPDYQDSGVKVFINRGKDSKIDTPENNKTNASVIRSSTSSGPAAPVRSAAKTPFKQSPPSKERQSPASDGEYTRSIADRRSSKSYERSGRTEPSRPKTAGDSRNASDMRTVPGSFPVSGNRIEGWLSSTSDPFAKSKSRTETDTHNRRRRFDEDQTTHADATTVSSRSVESDAVSEASTPTLQRRRARRSNTYSPIKESRNSGLANERRFSRQETQSIDTQSMTTDTASRLRDESATNSHKKRVGREDRPLSRYIDESVLSRASDGDEPIRRRSRRRRSAEHSDLISVLSLSKSAEGNAIKSANSIRARRSRRDHNDAGSIMNQVTTDELRYQRELRTLVDGVIPVLLTHVLQKSDPSGSKRLFSGSSRQGQALTQPIVEMGIALERLKSLHRRIPLHKEADLVTWAANASKAYAEYLKAWRLGFQDIVVNLAPADDHATSAAVNSWKTGVSKLQNGRSEKSGGERANVAYLLKRPLIRLKHLSQALEMIRRSQPSPAVDEAAAKYADLLKSARQKANDERARLEDEAAASIDPSRARDAHNLLPIAGVIIDATRSVKARDFFDLNLVHSSGQQIVCKIELIARDDAPSRGKSGDVLFCEVSLAGRWLLFPPVTSQYLSARHGEKDGEMVVMIRGLTRSRNEWREVFSLKSEDPTAVDEWISILGSSPLPSRLSKKSSFNVSQRVVPPKATPSLAGESIAETGSYFTTDYDDSPLGEQVKSNAHVWDASEVNSSVADSEEFHCHLRRSKATKHRSTMSQVSIDSYEQVHANIHSRSFGDRIRDDRSGLDTLPSRRSYDSSSVTWSAYSGASTAKKDYNVWMPNKDRWSDESSHDDDDIVPEPLKLSPKQERPPMHRGLSSVPSTEMPNIPRLRPSSSSISSLSRETSGSPPVDRSDDRAKQTSTPKKQDSEPRTGHNEALFDASHGRRTQTVTPKSRSTILPSLTPAFMKRHRRTSSPLKHEYEPSSASGSMSESESELESEGDDVESVTSESSAETVQEGVSTIGDLKGFHQYMARPLATTQQPSPALSPVEEASLGPSDSASQGPYRTVPTNGSRYATTYASLFYWSDNGAWTTLHPEECSLFISPGLIEAFDIKQALAPDSLGRHEDGSSPSQRGIRPLVALELTPLVPLRRGTALDISIRSPPTQNSVLRYGNNIMFRSRTPEECEGLYTLLNRARIDNPTYIALQHARGPIKTSNWSEAMDRQNAARSSSGSSWWPASLSRKSSTYRSKGSRAAASSAATESSVASLSSAFSALKRFSTGGRMFNIAKSTLTSREGTRSTTSDSLSSGLMSAPLTFDPRLGTPMGMTNTKIRLYLRESASKWRDMGSARMTVMMPPRDDPAIVNNPRATGAEKRILIYGKNRGETLLDVVLPETSFERVARTGIAVSVWHDSAEPAAVGGVGSATLRVYMVQMKSEREAAFTFSLVGKLRY